MHSPFTMTHDREGTWTSLFILQYVLFICWGRMMEIYTFSIYNDACSGGQMVEMYPFSMTEDESARADAQNYLNKNGSKKSIF